MQNRVTNIYRTRSAICTNLLGVHPITTGPLLLRYRIHFHVIKQELKSVTHLDIQKRYWYPDRAFLVPFPVWAQATPRQIWIPMLQNLLYGVPGRKQKVS